MDQASFKTLQTRRVTTEHQLSTIVTVEGEVTGTEDFYLKPVPELADALAKVLAELPHCQKFIVEVGKNIRFERIESVTPKDCLVMDNPDKCSLRHILHSADIL
jgi:hypothetical protein